MITSLLLLASAQQVLGLDMTGFGEDALVYVTPSTETTSSTLIWPRGTILRVEDRAGELIVHFDRSIDDAAVARFEAEAGSYVQSLRWNDDSLLLRANPGVVIQSDVKDNRLAVSFDRRDIDDRKEPSDVAPTDAEKDMAMVAIRADIASGFMGSARRKAERLAARYPDDRDVIRLAADAQAADGDARAAAKTYRKAGAQDKAARRTMALGPGQASIVATVRDGSGFTQAEAGGRANLSVRDNLTVGVGVRHIITRTDAAIVNDSLRSDIDSDATLADLTLTMQLAPRLSVDVTGSAWLDSGVVGGGARLVYGSSDTQVRLSYVRHLPDLSFAEQALSEGSLSQLTLGGSAQILPELRSRLDLGWRRYGLASIDDAGETLTVAGQIDYILLRRPVTLSLGYRIDAEYLQALARGPSGLARLPLGNRENHTVQAFASGAAGPILLTGGAGWTVDRYGGSGPNASLAAAAPIGTQWQLDAGVGLTSISRPGFPARQMFGRIELRRGLGNGR